MPKNLVIVESPAKAKTIEKFLGNDFKVVSSNGHIADLPSKELGINLDNNYEPKYIVNSDKKDIVKKLKKESKTADMVWVASDEDREGEAIAWHLYELLGLNKENLGGGLFSGNVIDMLRVSFFPPIFNLADSFITIGCFLGLFFYRKLSGLSG